MQPSKDSAYAFEMHQDMQMKVDLYNNAQRIVIQNYNSQQTECSEKPKTDRKD